MTKLRNNNLLNCLIGNDSCIQEAETQAGATGGAVEASFSVPSVSGFSVGGLTPKLQSLFTNGNGSRRGPTSAKFMSGMSSSILVAVLTKFVMAVVKTLLNNQYKPSAEGAFIATHPRNQGSTYIIFEAGEPPPFFSDSLIASNDPNAYSETYCVATSIAGSVRYAKISEEPKRPSVNQAMPSVRSDIGPISDGIHRKPSV
eukprot:CAMPEP_0169292020 /NCGR_PEP_ID=MMETSP1016-20121227/62548_1 /TAXON_ID=342587 /ORGANISM="Karlodinium micrum, Strain CCMP2283" /LENGTH=200 /DNA_ID=CAMNT_0009382645 /DNA_START=256 /DNA_END=858 /DNA_ORIENTATION=+